MKILNYPHPALRFPAAPLTRIDARIQNAARAMLDLMYEHRGLGLAGPQVGLPFQLIVLNFTGDPEKKESEGVWINPVILDKKGTIDDEEGCLSFPKLFQKVRRGRTVRVQAYNLQGEAMEINASELPARAWQHEIDHLHGVLFIDKMGPVGKLASRTFLKEYERDYAKAQEKGELPSNKEIEKELAALAATA